MISFCYDDMGDFGLGYPNLARRDIESWQFDDAWPRTVPLRLLLYLQAQHIDFDAHLVAHAPAGSWYPIAMAWHDFDCDYIGLLQPLTRERLCKQEIRLLFYYHEGDNPHHIRNHLRRRCQEHAIPPDCFMLVSANGAADKMEQCCYFPDHEYFFRWLNRSQSPSIPDDLKRSYRFTALNRLHKSWRAHVMADLSNLGVLDNSLWSYNTQITMENVDQDNPFDLDKIEGWGGHVQRFLENGPYECDGTDAQVHNDHTSVNSRLYTDSYCHIVLETMMDADGSRGAFMTEKTYKCIKYGQPFVIIGTVGSLGQLRKDGYRTFDHVIDPTYDTIQDSTLRYLEIRKVLDKIIQQDLQEFFQSCLPDILHNQRIFLDLQSQGLNRLVNKLK